MTRNVSFPSLNQLPQSRPPMIGWPANEIAVCIHVFLNANSGKLKTCHEAINISWNVQRSRWGRDFLETGIVQVSWGLFLNCPLVICEYTTREVNELLEKYICSVLPARRESDTFPARKGWQEFFKARAFLLDQEERGLEFFFSPPRGNKNSFPGRTFCRLKEEGCKNSPWSAAHGGRRGRISQEKLKREIVRKPGL